MKVTFIVPELNVTGGLRVVSVYARFLADKGHTITVVSPNKKKPTLKQLFKSFLIGDGLKITSKFDATFFDNPAVKVKVLNRYRPVKTEDIPDADIVIATFWNTAEWVSEYPQNKGKKVYFLQHYEIHPWLPVERVKATLRLSFKKIAVSQWIADIIKNEYADSDTVVIPNGVSDQQFSAPARNKQTIPTIGMMYSNRSFKGCDMAFKAFHEAKKIIPALKLVAFGADIPDSSLPVGTEYCLRPDQEQLKEIYSQCDAWLFASRFEGFGLPILEAMACRTPVIGTQCGSAPELINGNNGILINIDDTAAMEAAIIQFANMSNEEWVKSSNEAFEISKKYQWTDSCNRFEETLMRFLRDS